MNLVLNNITKKQIDYFISKPFHALLLTGPKGIGKKSVARQIAYSFFKKSADFNQHVRVFSASDPNFGKETIKDIQKFLKTKHTSDSQINRIVILNDANHLLIDSQNKLLKTLEEPPTGSLLILCTPNKNMVIQTIVSRCQHINVITPDYKDIANFFRKNYQDHLIENAYKISGGLPGLMTALLSNSDHPLVAATDISKKILSSNHFDKLCYAESLSKDKEALSDVTFMLQQISHSALKNSHSDQSKKWAKILQAAYDADEMLAQNVSAKLVCNKLLLSV